MALSIFGASDRMRSGIIPMKTHFYLLPLLALCPALALAQPKAAPTKTAPQISIEPAAQALLDKATATYNAAQGIRFEVSRSENGEETITSSVETQKPNLLRLYKHYGSIKSRFLDDGSKSYYIRGDSYSQSDVTGQEGPIDIAFAGMSGSSIGEMLRGNDPIQADLHTYKSGLFTLLNAKTVAIGTHLVDGDALQGVRTTISHLFSRTPGKERKFSIEETYWFGGPNALLRRVDNRTSGGLKAHFYIERIFNQQLNPTFAPNAFKFDPTGLKLASDEDESYFDKRLVVGAQPFAFSAKALNGRTISPASYKGKVLLMDFWATWCGPCVASLPELQAAYKKYHAQGLEVVGISLDEDKSALTSFVKDNKMPWPQVFDGKGWKSAVPGVYGVRAIPFMLVVGRDGKIAAVNPRGKIDSAVQAALAQK